jgi:hypothetical protein
LFHVLGEKKGKAGICLGDDNNCWSGSAIGRDVRDFCHLCTRVCLCALPNMKRLSTVL